ncbi:restriction endonuclease [Microbacterium sorbitolivorans]|uniref:Restriction endonuclease n=1 Tax=Microbacterium sorbitolivorans TaxID=1867410 RepID=A0A367XTJ1_9MICO|nr:restriction endonuclease [Microbacterium sorbitolivorans]RCK56943.1 restriction endonuclease [Microbacterium sorbitolivorans]
MSFPPSQATPQSYAQDFGRYIGARAPLKLPDAVLAEAVWRTVSQEVPAAAPRIGPRPVFWYWWVVFSFGVIAVGAGTEAVFGAGPLVSLFMTTIVFVGATCLGVFHAWKRFPYDRELGLAVAAARALTDEVRSLAFSSAMAEARRPGRLPPAFPLLVSFPAPQPRPNGVSPEEAEWLVAEWMRFLGAADAEVTRYSADGGIDVVSTTHIAQVKNLSAGYRVPVAQIRELAGVAAHDRRQALFFTSGSYTASGLEFADRAGIALFTYDAMRGTLDGVNGHGRSIRAQGLTVSR